MRPLQKQLDQILETAHGEHLLLHSCCAPCSSYVLEYLSTYFTITLFFYNPNIMPSAEYHKRLGEVTSLLAKLHTKYPITLLEGAYCPQDFLTQITGYEQEPEGGERCTICYHMRMKEAARAAKACGADYFTTTLSISPHKNAEKLDAIAVELEAKYGVAHLPSDFKKKGGYQRSIVLSKELGIYRQDWCGCVFSRLKRE